MKNKAKRAIRATFVTDMNSGIYKTAQEKVLS